MNKLLAALALILLAVAGWFLFGRQDGPWLTGGAVKVSAEGSALLDYIPADTPYVLAGLQPVPEAVAEAMWAQAEASVAVWPQLLTGMRSDLAREGSEGAEATLKLLDALEAEFRGKSLPDVIDHLGLPRTGVGAVYGIGPLPVARIALTDATRIEGLIERLQAAGGFELERRELGAARYWTLPADAMAPPLRPLLALIDNQLVISLHPAEGSDALLRQLLGLDKPAQSQADSGDLAQRATELGFLPYAVGFVDSLRLFDQLTDPDHPSTTVLRAALKAPLPELDATCRSELRAMAARFPGLSIGLTRFDADGNTVRSIFHTDADIAAELLKLRAPMPGGDFAQDEALLSLGMALSLKELPGVVSRLAARVTEAPYACAELAPLNAAAAEAGKGINNPAVFAAAPVLNGLRLSIDRLSLPQGPLAPDASGSLLIGSDNPASLIGLARSFVPELASLQVPADGTPVPLPALPNAPPDLPAIEVAMSGDVLGLATADSAASLGQRLRRDAGYQPLFAGQVRPALYELIADFMEFSANGLAGSEREQMLLQARLMRETYARTFTQSVFSVEFSERGVEMVQAMQTR